MSLVCRHISSFITVYHTVRLLTAEETNQTDRISVSSGGRCMNQRLDTSQSEPQVSVFLLMPVPEEVYN